MSTAGGSFKQTAQSFDYAESILKNEIAGQTPKQYISKILEEPRKPVSKKTNEYTIKIAKSSMKGVSIAGDILGFRGFRVNVGEMDDVPRETLTLVIEPFMNVQYDPMSDLDKKESDSDFYYYAFRNPIKNKNSILLSGTLSYDYTAYWNTINQYLDYVKNGSKEHGIVILDFQDTYIGDSTFDHPNVKRRYFKMDLNNILNSFADPLTDKDIWNSQNKNRVMVSSGREYGPEMVFNSYKSRDGMDSRIIPLLSSDRPCVFGIDPSKSSMSYKNAEFSLVVNMVDEDRFRVVSCFGKQGMSHLQMTATICKYFRKFPGVRLICIDQGGAGSEIKDNLRNRATLDMLGYPDIPLIIDPDDIMNAPLIMDGTSPYVSILRMLAPSAEKNTIWNNFLKSSLESHTQLMPRTYINQAEIFDTDNLPKEYLARMEEIKDEYLGIHMLKIQLTKVQLERAGNYFKYFIAKGQKDRYSAMVYASAGVQMIRQMGIQDDADDVGGCTG